MAKKIEVDIAHLKSIGLSQKQISDIIKNAEPDHWTNQLPQDFCYELMPFMVTPETKLKETVTIYLGGQSDPMTSFFTEQDADFIQNKCRLLIEMSNFSFAVNEDWCPDWNNKDEKKYGIVLQNGQARVSENELFNLYVFGIVTKSRSLALEMLEEFKERVELYFNKPFNSVNQNYSITELGLQEKEYDELFSTGGVKVGIGGIGTTTTNSTNKIHGTIHNTDIHGTIHNTDIESPFIGSFEPRYENATTRKKRKVLKNDDISKIQDLLLNDVPQKEIAEQFDYSQGTISRIKKRLGFKMIKRTT
jgi:DNA-binding CsgD family transcriptional regulator